jgi:hypothetical protein
VLNKTKILKMVFYYKLNNWHFNYSENIMLTLTNNLALCALYEKKNILAIQKLEQLVSQQPIYYMQDALVFNLCTIYDLSYAPDIATQKKKILQKIALRYQLVDPILHWRSFRMT